jgi:GMP synthase (glutamine-hydrolysing)
LAENNHSEHQAFSYDQGGVSFWGAQYHPELRTKHVAYYLEDGDSIFAGKSALIADLNNAEIDAQAAARLGTVPRCANGILPHNRTCQLVGTCKTARGSHAATMME